MKGQRRPYQVSCKPKMMRPKVAEPKLGGFQSAPPRFRSESPSSLSLPSRTNPEMRSKAAHWLGSNPTPELGRRSRTEPSVRRTKHDTVLETGVPLADVAESNRNSVDSNLMLFELKLRSSGVSGLGRIGAGFD